MTKAGGSGAGEAGGEASSGAGAAEPFSWTTNHPSTVEPQPLLSLMERQILSRRVQETTRRTSQR